MEHRVLAAILWLFCFSWLPATAQELPVDEQLRRNGAVSLPKVALIDTFLGAPGEALRRGPDNLHVNVNDAKAFGRDGLKLLQSAPRLRQVCLTHNFPEDWCVDLAALKQLEGLYFANSPFSFPQAKSGLREIGKMQQLCALSLAGTRINDEQLRHLSSLTKLRFLCLAGTAITDEGLRSLSDMVDLEEIDLDRTKVGGEGLVHLRKASKLRRIRITNDRGGLDANGLKHLAKMPNLREIVGRGNICSAEDVKALASAPKLESLDLGEAGLSDDGLEILLRFSSLRRLNLTATGITGKGLKVLAKAKRLEELALSLTAVDDESLDYIVQMPQLRSVDLAGTKVTPMGIEKLKKQRPDLEVFD